MGEIILKKEGNSVELDQFPKANYPYLENYLVFLNSLVDQLNNSESINFQVNLVEFGKLGSELLLDNRLDSEKIESSFDSINKLNAICIYYTGLNGNFLLEEFREHKICYIELQQTYEINMIRIAFHEIHHFFDPFIPSEWQTYLENGQPFLDYEKTIKAYVRIGLNEYYANLHAFSRCLSLINDILMNNTNPSLIREFNNALIERIPSYIYNLSDDLKDFIDVIRSGEINNRSIIDPKVELIKFLWSRFFHSIYYFLGGWKVYEDRSLNTDTIQIAWDDFIREIQCIGLNYMIILLNSFSNLMMEGFESENDLVNRIELIFLEYYREKLDSDFTSLIDIT